MSSCIQTKGVLVFTLFLLATLPAACDESDGSGGGSAERPESAASRLQQSEACKKYVACTSAVAPSGLSVVLDAYGPDGNCWGETKDLWRTCDDACVRGTEDWAAKSPDEPSCWACTENADCEEPTSACKLEEHVCVPPESLPCSGACTEEAPGCYDRWEGGDVCLPYGAICLLTYLDSKVECLYEPACEAFWGPGGPCASASPSEQSCDGLFSQACIDAFGVRNYPPTECLNC